MKKTENTSSLRWISQVAGRNKLNIVILLVIQMVLGVSGVYYAVILRDLIDAAATKSRAGFFTAAAVFAGLVVCQIALQAVERFLEEYTRASVENQCKKRLFSFLLNRDYARVSATHSGEWMNRLTSDTVVVADGLTQIVPGVAGMLVKLTGALIMILILAPRFGYVLIPGGVLLVVLTYGFRKVLKKLHKHVQEADGTVRVFLQETLGSMLVVKAFAKENQTLEQSAEKMEQHKKARMKKNHFSNICNIGFGGLMNGAYVCGAIVCGYGILVGAMSYGTFMAILQLIGQIQYPFANITGYLPRYYAMLASAERLMEVEVYPGDSEESDRKAYPGDREESGGKAYPGDGEESGRKAYPGDREESGRKAYPGDGEEPGRKAYSESGEQTGVARIKSLLEIQNLYQSAFTGLCLQDVAFTYQSPVKDSEGSMPVVLSGVNLEIKKGEYVAFTGPSGCGKSTILKLLMCLYSLDSGKRLITMKKPEAESADTRCEGGLEKSFEVFLTADYRRLFAYVPQGNHLMSGTIREIITFFDKEAMKDEDRIWNALSIACGADFVRDLDQEIDTVLGERGTGLSEGQMQRIAIARAVFSDNPILMLDESTSALDEKTEKALLHNLRSMTDKTVLIVTHRTAVLDICDKEIRFSKDGVKAHLIGGGYED